MAPAGSPSVSMGQIVLIAVAAGIVSGLPLLVRTRKILVNPALFMFLIVAWSPLFKTLYIAVTGPRVSTDPFAGVSLARFLLGGAMLALVATVAYAGSFVVVGRRTLPGLFGPRWRHIPGPYERRAVAVLTALCVLCFLGYLRTSGTEFFSLPFSAKRFLPGSIGVSTRFGYPPYYFFKAALVSGSVAYAAAYLLFRAPAGPSDRSYRALFAVVFTFALVVSHFASLRLFIVLVLVQIGILLYHVRDRRHTAFIGGFAVLTAASFVVISFVHRLPGSVDTFGSLESGDSVRSEDSTSGGRGGPGVRGRGFGREAAEAVELRSGVQRLARGVFGGRYFMDIGKLSYVASYFPHEHPYAMGRGFVGFLNDPESVDGRSRALPGGMSKYLAAEVLGEPNNSVPPGYAGELYINFGWVGVVLGFLLLGAFHRVMFNYLTRPDLSLVAGACLVLLIPSSTLVLLNSGLVSAGSRAVIDLGVFLLVCPFWLRRRRAPATSPDEGPEAVPG